jgi:hypothetical protein
LHVLQTLATLSHIRYVCICPQLEPNIPAEVLYDKRDDGLKPSNAWKGYHVLLNPDFRWGRNPLLLSHKHAADE